MKLKSMKYVIQGDTLYKKGIDGTFLRCVDSEQRKELLQLFHNEACGGHYSASVTDYKILRNYFYWSRMFKDVEEWVKKCHSCQYFKGRVQLAALPLKLVVIEEPFQ